MSNNHLYLSTIVLFLIFNFVITLPRNLKIVTSVQSAWSPTGSMNFERHYHTATVLSNGTVLVIGGHKPYSIAAQSELYDPSTGNWTIAASPNLPRTQHTSSLLPDGKVLITGGRSAFASPMSEAELYDPITNIWTLTDHMHDARYGHTASVLPNGKVLVTGGIDTWGLGVTYCELYDPSIGKWTVTSSMQFGRYYHAATTLPSGKVLVTGGAFDGLNASELYDPLTGSWTGGGDMNNGRSDHTSSLLMNGQVLVTGGDFIAGNFDGEGAELYNPSTDTWTKTNSMHVPRTLHQASLLMNGQILVTGGNVHAATVGPNAELYNPSTETWTGTDNMHVNRYTHTASLLPNGKILVAGGMDSTDTVLNSVELYDPTTSNLKNAGTSGIARTLKNQLNNKYHFHQLTRKYSTMNLGCNVLESEIDICRNQIGGSASITSDIRPFPFGPACNNIDFHGNVVNISSSKNDTCDSYHYSGNLTASVSPGYRYNSKINTNDHMAANDIPSGVYNYTINAYITLCDTDFYANVALCNNGSCVIYDPIGTLIPDGANGTCTSYSLDSMIHSINETNTHI